MVELSAWEKALKIRSWASGAMPIPLSLTSMRKRAAGVVFVQQLGADDDLAWWVNPTALLIPVGQIWRRRTGSPHRASGRRGDRADQFDALGLGGAGEHAPTSSMSWRRWKSMVSISGLPASTFREVEDVVDDVEQVLAGLVNRVGKTRLLGVEGRAPEHLGHAEDGVHRRADLVAHGGEELALGLVGGLGDVLGAAQFEGADLDLVFELVPVAGGLRSRSWICSSIALKPGQLADLVAGFDRRADAVVGAGGDAPITSWGGSWGGDGLVAAAPAARGRWPGR